MHLQIRMCPAINELAFPYVVDQVLVRDLGLKHLLLCSFDSDSRTSACIAPVVEPRPRNYQYSGAIHSDMRSTAADPLGHLGLSETLGHRRSY